MFSLIVMYFVMKIRGAGSETMQNAILGLIRELLVPPELNIPIPRQISLRRRIDNMPEHFVCSSFRFRTREQLHRLYAALCLPEYLYSQWRHKFQYAELILVALYYMHWPINSTDCTFPAVFVWSSTKVIFGVKIFISWLYNNWSYLLTDNFDFWVPSFPHFAEKIHKKVEGIGCYFEPGSFNIFGFIDNTVYQTSSLSPSIL